MQMAAIGKEKGNELYKRGDWTKAIEAYSQGLKLDPNNSILHANRAMCYLKLNRFEECEKDCTTALIYDKCYVKALLRRAAAKVKLDKFQQAIEDYHTVLSLEPNNKQAKIELGQLKQNVNTGKIKSVQIQEYKSTNEENGYLADSRHYIVNVESEIQLCQSEGGYDLDLLYKNCKKNVGHSDFIPVKEFSMTHLPETYRDPDIFDFIKAAADMTVRMAIKKISPNRPQYWPDNKTPYPLYDLRGQKTLRVGSGEMRVYKFTQGQGVDAHGDKYNVFGETFESEAKNCPCDKCQHSVQAKQIWFEVHIMTAMHVIFDEIEASHSSIRLFFDEPNCPKVVLNKALIHHVSIEKDACVLKYMLCDEQLGNKLYHLSSHCLKLWKKVSDKYRPRPDVRMTFLVSHPHGCQKYISIGEWTRNEVVRDFNEEYNLTKLTYTTNTCPGSSGAQVYCLGHNAGHLHTGALDDKLNHSGVGFYTKQP